MCLGFTLITRDLGQCGDFLSCIWGRAPSDHQFLHFTLDGLLLRLTVAYGIMMIRLEQESLQGPTWSAQAEMSRIWALQAHFHIKTIMYLKVAAVNGVLFLCFDLKLMFS